MSKNHVPPIHLTFYKKIAFKINQTFVIIQIYILMALLLYKWLLSLSLFVRVFTSYTFIEDTKYPQIQEEYHPFYVSVTEIAHNKTEGSLEVSCKIFIEDLESILKKLYKKPVHLSDEKRQAESAVFINGYVSKHLKIWANGKLAKLNYVGYEKDSEAVFCYFEVDQIPAVNKLDIENSILQDLTDEQINIMHVTVNGKRQSHKLDFPNRKASFNF
jgi:hypothetical protein